MSTEGGAPACPSGTDVTATIGLDAGNVMLLLLPAGVLPQPCADPV